jgi:hypothetical protein
MCLNCGCGELDERHGDDANIVRADLQRAADANGQSIEETARNMVASTSRLSTGDERASTAQR